MKTLLLLRHAKPENAAAGSSDFDRVLSARGRSQALAVGEFVKKQNLKLDLVLSSPAWRARETTELVISAAGWPRDLRFDQRIYEAGVRELWSLLSEIEPATSSLMLVGHNPALEDLILTLTGRSAPMSPATLAQIILEIDQWSEIKKNTGSLDWLVKPTNSPINNQRPEGP